MLMHLAVAAVREQKRWLFNLSSMTDLPKDGLIKTARCFSPKQIEKMLRVEISRDEMPELIRDLGANFQDYVVREHLSGTREGPFTIEGVAYYEVAALPAPGWRVINPMVDG